MPPTIGTASAAQLFVALSVLQAPTVSSIPNALETPTRPALQITSAVDGLTPKVEVATVASSYDFNLTTRETTSLEVLIGEIRGWALFGTNWDGEGAAQPLEASIKQAVSFARLMGSEALLPEPMLLASGHTALFWHNDELYADLEFLGSNRMAYFIKKNGDKHKGVISFDSENLPTVFKTLLNI